MRQASACGQVSTSRQVSTNRLQEPPILRLPENNAV